MPAVAEPPPILLEQDAACAYHASVNAVCTCKLCGAAICSVCDLSQSDGSHICPNCATQEAPPPLINPLRLAPHSTVPPTSYSAVPPAPPMPAGVHCAQHAHLQATAQCKLCGAFMCQTCTFDLPGGLRICPECATAAPTVSPGRKKLIIGSFALAIWCTIVWASVLGGMFRGLIRDREGQRVLGWMLTLLVPIPSLIGLTLGVSSMERRSANPISMWIASVWNGVILAGFMLIFVIGMLKGGGQ